MDFFLLRTAQRLMIVARDVRLVDPTHASLLPPHWRTLYELTKLDSDQFDRALRRSHDGLQIVHMRTFCLRQLWHHLPQA